MIHRLGSGCKQIFKCNIPIISHQQRWLDTKALKSFKNNFREKDQIDEGYKLIYSPPKTELLLIANTIFTSTSLLSPVLVSSYCYAHFFTEDKIQINQLGALITISFGSLLIMYLIRTFPIRIYRNKDQYIAVLPGVTSANRKFHFKKGDVHDKNLTIDAKLPFLDAKVRDASWFTIKGKRFFLVTKHFERPRDLFDMFANSRKYVMQAKKMDKEEQQKLSK